MKPIGITTPATASIRRNALIFLAAALLVAVGQALILNRPTEAYEFPFNPANCKHDPKGNFYVALGRHVFGMPYAEEGNFIYNPLRAGNVGLRPPDPSDPIGCIGNPLQSSSHAFAYAYNVLTRGKDAAPAEQKPLPEMLTLYRVGKEPISGADDPEWPGESLQRDLWESTCRNAAVRDTLANGLMACRVRLLNPPDFPQEEWATSYQAKSEIYTTPIGAPFLVNCGPLLVKSAISHCDVSYTMMPGLGVSYRFQPFFGVHAIAIDKIVEFDKSLRATLDTRMVKDFAWPDLTPAGWITLDSPK
jgi:hypothetical protein